VFFDPQNKILYNKAVVSLNPFQSSLTRINTFEKVQIITNPAKDVLKLRFKSDAINYLQILDLDGRQEIMNSGKQEGSVIEIDIRNLQPGMYIIKASSAGWSETKKFIVTK
jgi:hypothetical protein